MGHCFAAIAFQLLYLRERDSRISRSEGEREEKQRKRWESFCFLILWEGISAQADGAQSETDRDLPPSASTRAFPQNSQVAPFRGAMQAPKAAPGRVRAPRPCRRRGCLRPRPSCSRIRPVTPPHPLATRWIHQGHGAANAGAGYQCCRTKTPIPNPQP